MNKYIPIVIVVLSNIFYHICTKSAPEEANPFASLVVTYGLGAVVCFILYLITKNGTSIAADFGQINWTSWVLGIVIVGLEAGYIYMYRVGWEISTGQIVQAAILAICLIFVGALFYKERITLTRAAGIMICLVGLILINKP